MKSQDLINWKGFFHEEQLIDTLVDKEEAALRERLLDEISEKAADYYAHVNKYNYEHHCRAIVDRGLRFRAVSKSETAQKWDEFFASGLTEQEKKEIYYEDFKWHMFSYGKIDAKEASEARRVFNRTKKGGAYLFIEGTDEAWYIENAHLLKAADVGVDYYFERADVYIFDENGKWAYARTHESFIGPYFLRRKK